MPSRAWRSVDPALYSAKTCAAALLALWISLMVGLPMPFWAMTTAYIVSNPLSGATRSKAIYRVAGTVIGATAAVVMVPLLVDWPILLSAAMAAWVGCCLTVSLLDRSPRAYVVMLAGYTSAIIAFPSVDAPSGIFDLAAARVTEIVLGIVCSTLMHSLVFPRSVGSALVPRLHRWLGDAEHWLAETLDGNDRGALAQNRQQLAVDAVECALMAMHIPYDTSHWREATRVLRGLLDRILLLMPLLSGLADRQRALGSQPDSEVEGASALVRDWLAAGSQPDGMPLLGAEPDAEAPDPDWRALLVISFRVRLAQIVVTLAQCRQLLAHLEDPHTPIPADIKLTAAGDMRLHTDTLFAVLSGISAAMAIVLCCALWITTSWPDGGTAAALTAVFCCLFASLDNPVPVILRFGSAMVASIPIAGLYLFAILPRVDGFWELTAVLAPPLLVIGYFLPSPRFGTLALAWIMGFCSALALQENFSASFDHFVNSNIGQLVAVILAVGTTAGIRNLGADFAVGRSIRALHTELIALASAPSAPRPEVALARSIDQLAILSQRMSIAGPSAAANEGLREVRLAMNIVDIQQLREAAAPRLRIALGRLLRKAAQQFAKLRSSQGEFTASPEVLLQIDRVLRVILAEPPLVGQPLAPDRTRKLAALVAFRSNLFPDAPAFRANTAGQAVA